MTGLTRALYAVAATVAGLGAYGIYTEIRSPGTPVRLGPVLALIGGAVAFAILERRRARAGPSPGAEQGIDRLPAGLTISGEARRGLALALTLAVIATFGYAAFGFGLAVLVAWLGSWVLAAGSLRSPRAGVRGTSGLCPGEIAFLGCTMAVLALLVLPYAAVMPFEISTDEIYSIGAVRDFAEGRATDPLGLVGWWGLPALQFASLAVVGLVSGMSIEAMRLVSGLVAIATVLPFYLWVRTLNGRTTAIVATVILAGSHAFIGWGRIALTQNVPVFLFALAMALLATGLRDRSSLKLLLGGIVLGLGWHTYPSGQVLVLIWAAVLGSSVLLRTVRARDLAPVATLTLIGFLLAALPMFVSVFGNWDVFSMRARGISITNPAAVALMGGHLGLQDSAVILRENLVRGLLSFNGPYPYVTYHNPGAGFVDPLTGTLLWLGVAAAIVRIRHLGLRVAGIGFLAVFAAGLLTEGAPVHGRLLVALPCVAILSATALLSIGRALAPGVARGRVRRRLAAAFLVVFVVTNLVTFRGFVRAQLAGGKNDVATAIGRTLGMGIEMTGPVARFLGQKPRWDSRRLVVLLDDPDAPMHLWADEEAWVFWAAFFSDPDRVRYITDLSELEDAPASRFARGFWDQATLFMRRGTWERERDRLTRSYPGLEHEHVTDNRAISAVHLTR
jgi:hypothetical protein